MTKESRRFSKSTSFEKRIDSGMTFSNLAGSLLSCSFLLFAIVRLRGKGSDVTYNG